MDTCRIQIINRLGRVVLFAALATMPGVVTAQDMGSNIAHVVSTATIVKSLSVVNTGDLAFGEIVTGSGGTVSIAPNGSRTASGVTLGNADGIRAAAFGVVGDHNATYTITLPADGVVNLSGPDGMTMPVNGFVSNVTNPNAVLDGSGLQSLSVGATLTVNAGQEVGVYAGWFDVTVNYN